MTEQVLETVNATEVLDEKLSEAKKSPKLDVLEREKQRKQAILNTKYQKEFMVEQNKLMEAQNKRMRLDIENQELSARSWKAWYEKMYYSLECEKIEPEYKEYQERAKARIEEEQKKNQPQVEAIPQEQELDINTLQEIPNRE